MKLTKERVAEYVELEKQRAELSKQARALEAKARLIGKDILAAMGDKNTMKRGPFTCSRLETPGRIAWKDACLPLLAPGQLEELQAAAKPSVRLVVTTQNA